MCTTWGFEALQAGFSSSVLMANLVPDGDGTHSCMEYASGNPKVPLASIVEKH